MKLNRPEPLQLANVRRVSTIRQALDVIRRGERCAPDGPYAFAADGVEVLTPEVQGSFAQRRAAAAEQQEALSRWVVPIASHQVDLPRSPVIGFLSELYPEQGRFWLPAHQVVGLHRAWMRFEKGVRYAVLGDAIHPFYGTYTPQRTEHLELFATWLAQYQGGRRCVVDVGTGSGILALMLARAGFDRVIATDLNPNAVESVRRETTRRKLAEVVSLHSDLLEQVNDTPDLIVFNPPWIPGSVRTAVDQALYFEPGLFERFFEQAAQKLAPGGRVVVVFSDVMTLLRPEMAHPVESAVKTGGWEQVSRLRRRVKPKSGRRTRERVEIWELART